MQLQWPECGPQTGSGASSQFAQVQGLDVHVCCTRPFCMLQLLWGTTRGLLLLIAQSLQKACRLDQGTLLCAHSAAVLLVE